MAKKFKDLRAAIKADPVRRERIKQQKRAIETALDLGRLREERAATQRDIAAKMAVSQANVSRIEHEDDIYLSTLRGYVEALGGQLVLQAVFADATIEIGTATPQSEIAAISAEDAPLASLVD
jgi:predicted transcriptional regulator